MPTPLSYNNGALPTWVAGDDGNGNLVSIGGGGSGIGATNHGVNSVPFTNSFTAVSTSSVTILAAGPYKTVIIANVGATLAYVNLAGGTAVVAQCIPLLPNGAGTLVLDNTTPSNLITAISSGAGTTLAVTTA